MNSLATNPSAIMQDRRFLAGNRRPLTSIGRNPIMAARKDITADFARQILDYDAAAGVLIWRPRTPEMFRDGVHSAQRKCRAWNAKFAGKIAGCVEPRLYARIRIYDALYYVHRIAWLIVHGEWPQDELDHRLGLKNGDKIENLRPATRPQNLQNAATPSNNTSGHVGVSWNKAASKWHAYITVDRHRIHLGYFADRNEAAAAYLTAKKKHHPFQPVPRGA